MRWKRAGAGLLLCFLIVIILGSLPGIANTAPFAGGSGTAADPYKITTAVHLNNIRNYPAACFVLCNDIVFSDGDFAAGGAFYNNGNGWEPIGYNGTNFTGTLDGKGYTVKNLQISRNGTVSYFYFGLFSVVYGTVKDLHLTEVKIEINTTDSIAAGGIAGSTLGTLTGCSVGGEITVKSSTLARAGGISGITDPNAIFRNNLNESTVTASGGTAYAGGVVGHLRGTVSECVNVGSIFVQNSNQAWVGGIVGNLPQGEVRNCFSTGAVTVTGTGNYRNAGGIAGVTNGTIKTSYSVGRVEIASPAPTANDGLGGIAGKTESEASLSACYYLTGPYKTTGGTALSATAMKSASAFTGFDFSAVWTMAGNADYPCPELRAVKLEGFPHQWSETGTDPTCTQGGKTVSVCLICNASKTETLPATGHKFSNWWSTKNSSCTESGTEMRRCSVCNGTETRDTEPTGHRYTEAYVSKHPSCTAAGVRTYNCTLCFSAVTEEIPPMGHTFGEWVTVKPPSCEKQGTRERKCPSCGMIESEIVAALGHQFIDPVTVQSPTCTEPGTETGTCYQCEETTNQKIPPTGHTFGAVQILKQATETEAGLSEQTCTVCGETEQTEIPALSGKGRNPETTDGTDSTGGSAPTDSPDSSQNPDSDGKLKNPRRWIYWALGGAWGLFAAGAWILLRH